MLFSFCWYFYFKYDKGDGDILVRLKLLDDLVVELELECDRVFIVEFFDFIFVENKLMLYDFFFIVVLYNFEVVIEF